MKNYLLLISLALFGCSELMTKKRASYRILPVSKVNWEKLNPARGDKSPQAGTLWGDRKGKDIPTAFLAKFVDGFSSPAHIHNVSYRAIVISGLVHNDDKNAASMWMPTGSYWTQPAGEAHITSAKGKTNIALVEIDSAPYLVRPVSKAFDNGERPYNIHYKNILWRKTKDGEVVDLWKDHNGKIIGSMYKFDKKLTLNNEKSKIVTVQGKVRVQNEELLPGSLIETEKSAHITIECLDKKPCLIYKKF